MAQYSFRDTLKLEFEARKQRNPRFSLRAFAKHLSLSPGQLSEIFLGKKGFSISKARTVAAILKLSEQDHEAFLSSVEAECSRAPTVRKKAEALLIERKKLREGKQALSADFYRLVAEWEHFAILALSGTPDFKSDPDWIADQLGISTISTKLAVRRLIRIGALVENKGKLKASGNLLASPTGVGSEAVRKHHRQIFEKAVLALYNTPVHQRSFGETTCAFRPEDLPEIQHKKNQFLQAIYDEYGTRPGRTEVYSLGGFIFPLTTRKKA